MGHHLTSANIPPLLNINEFKPSSGAQAIFHHERDCPEVEIDAPSSFSEACGIPTYSESLTMNDGKTAQGNEVCNWRTSAPEFVPKGLN